MQTYKFRIYPTPQQHRQLIYCLNKCRVMYNSLISYMNSRGKCTRKERQYLVTIFTRRDKESPGLDPTMSGVPFKVLQYENWKINRQLKSLKSNKSSGRTVGRLKFKNRDNFNSFSFNGDGFKIVGDKIRLSKIGEIKIIKHRIIDDKIKHVNVVKEVNQWYVVLVTEDNNWLQELARINFTKKRVAIDLGLKDFIVDSHGKYISRQKSILEYEYQIAKLNRDLARCVRGSNNRKKVKQQLQKEYIKLKKYREDFHHKVSSYYANEYDIVYCEDLKVSEMTIKKKKGNKKGKGLRKNIYDAGWTSFLNILSYKLQKKGGELIKVPARGTTKRCCMCWNEKEMRISDRVYECNKCGLIMQRDLNSAFNIELLGRYIEQGRNYPVLEGSSDLIKKEQNPMNQESILEIKHT